MGNRQTRGKVCQNLEKSCTNLIFPHLAERIARRREREAEERRLYPPQYVPPVPFGDPVVLVVDPGMYPYYGYYGYDPYLYGEVVMVNTAPPYAMQQFPMPPNPAPPYALPPNAAAPNPGQQNPETDHRVENTEENRGDSTRKDAGRS